MNRGFAPIVIALVIGIMSLITAGGVYTVNKINGLEKENAKINDELQMQKEITEQTETSSTTDESSANTDIDIENEDSKSIQAEIHNVSPVKITNSTSDATEEVTNLKEEISNLEKQVNTVKNNDILEDTPVADSVNEFDWKYWVSQESSLKQTKSDLNKVIDSKEKTISLYEQSKDSYAKWSPLLKDTIAGDIASKGYDYLDVAIDNEQTAIDVGNEYKVSINKVLDAIELDDRTALEIAVKSNNSKFEQFKSVNEEAQASAQITKRNLENFNNVLVSMGY